MDNSQLARLLIVFGCTSWTIAYVIIVAKGLQMRRPFMPPPAAFACFTWELFWCVFVFNLVRARGSMNLVEVNFFLWPVLNSLNILIHITDLSGQGHAFVFRRLLPPIAGSLCLAVVLLWAMEHWGNFYALDVIGYSIALFVSVLFLIDSIRKPPSERSFHSGLFRLLGTSCCAMSSAIAVADIAVIVISTFVFVADFLYLTGRGWLFPRQQLE